MSKFPEIVIDKEKNSPINLMAKLDIDRYYDFMHHTHKTSDLVNDSPGIRSAYNNWKDLGNEGTEEEFVQLLSKVVDDINKLRPITDEEILALFNQ
jgi:hypothetical protein